MIVTIVPATGVDSYVIGTPDTATVTIADDPPVVSVTATDASAAEAGAEPGVFTFTRTGGDTSGALNVFVSRDGTASNGGDYAAIGGGTLLVTIAAGQASAQVTISPVDDTLVEGDETVVLTLQAATGYTIGPSGTATSRTTTNEASASGQRDDRGAPAEPEMTRGIFLAARTRLAKRIR
jgi:hypothetical protein